LFHETYLLLEDHGGTGSVLTRLLEEEEYYVTSTALVGVARELLERVKFDLFIADVLLPDGTAFAALDVAKMHKVAYFLMTGSTAHMAELEANGQFHLSKPFKLTDFMNAVRDRIGPGDHTGRN
jgi:DNA-binding response OmpR family regulator